MRSLTVKCLYTLLLISSMLLAAVAPRISGGSCEEDDQTELVVSLLQQFCNNVKELPNEAFEDSKLADQKKNTMCNKINAVVHQIEAGECEGSLAKLRNDVENVIVNWIGNEWEGSLLSSIEHIIDIIRGLCCVDLAPPKIHVVYQYPREPEYDEYVLVLAYITDCKSGVANATLSYSVNSGENINITMNKTADLYTAEIPPQPYNLTVTYLVYAYDKAGNLAVSAQYSYIIGDYHPPLISYVERVPASPNYNETVLIIANVTEPSSASGVKEVVLTYNNGTVSADVTMSFNGTLYVASIPEFPYGTVVQYRISALDNAGNLAVMDIYSYVVDDRFLPVARIDYPGDGSSLSKCVDVTVFAYDDNLSEARLIANGIVLDSWSEAGSHTYMWNTTELDDGNYILTLEAYDQAGNIAETDSFVIVDNTLPEVCIQWPLDGSYVRDTVVVEVSAWDVNFEEMELKIGVSVQVWERSGTQTYTWNTTEYFDGFHNIILTARDRAGNEAETSVAVTVDNTPPLINNLTWVPSEPEADESVNVSVQVFEEGSRINNVTLWLKINDGEWENLTMTPEDSNWTCTIPGQAENATVIFYVECYDNAGNFGVTSENSYTVGVTYVSGFPLHWLLAIIAIIVAIVSSTAYYYKYRKKRGTS